MSDTPTSSDDTAKMAKPRRCLKGNPYNGKRCQMRQSHQGEHWARWDDGDYMVVAFWDGDSTRLTITQERNRREVQP